MKIAKRIVLFVAVNVLIVATLSIVLGLLGISPSIRGQELRVQDLAVFCLVWGFGGAFISLGLSRVMAKWMMGVRVLDKGARNSGEQELVARVHRLSRQAGLAVMPEVGIYDSPEVNAFATGPTRNRALVAVSTGLLSRMSDEQVEGVLAHEVAHVANGDMVTMTLVQGVVNALVMFLARVAAWFAGQFVEEEKRPAVQFGIVLVAELGLGLAGMIVVSYFSRKREYRADHGGATLAGPAAMIAALKGLKIVHDRAQDPALIEDGRSPALASLKISGRSSWASLFSTHPELDDRIRRLEEIQAIGK